MRCTRPPSRPRLLAALLASLVLAACASEAPGLAETDDAGLDDAGNNANNNTGDDTGANNGGGNNGPADAAANNGGDDIGANNGAPDARPDADAPEDIGPEDATPDTTPEDATPDAAPDDVNTCPPGEPCNPIQIPSFPYVDRRDTSRATSDAWDRYACSPDTNEGGPEFVYVFDLAQRGVVNAFIDEVDGDGIDVDVHLLGSVDPDECLERGHAAVTALLDPGQYWLALDTWVNGQGVEMAGPYTLTVEFAPVATGACATMTTDLEMVWSSCDPSIDCTDAGGRRVLHLPALGPVVKEAHLVTVDEAFPSTWPTTARDQIDRHYQLSANATGYVMSRSEPWAPAGEGGSEYGQGSTGAKVPVVAEAWYVNMYWRQRPAAGTRMIITNPANGRSVVAAAGFETGPGANTAIGGVSEEIHDYLGTGHRDTLMLGFAEDQTLPYGPIDCQ